MAKGGDLIGRSGGAGFGSGPVKPSLSEAGEKKPVDPKHPDFQPPKDVKPAKGGKGPAGGPSGASTVRPKV